MSNKIKVAAVQMAPKLTKTDENLESILAAAKKAAKNHADEKVKQAAAELLKTLGEQK